MPIDIIRKKKGENHRVISLVYNSMVKTDNVMVILHKFTVESHILLLLITYTALFP